MHAGMKPRKAPSPFHVKQLSLRCVSASSMIFASLDGQCGFSAYDVALIDVSGRPGCRQMECWQAVVIQVVWAVGQHMHGSAAPSLQVSFGAAVLASLVGRACR